MGLAVEAHVPDLVLYLLATLRTASSGTESTSTLKAVYSIFAPIGECLITVFVDASLCLHSLFLSEIIAFLRSLQSSSFHGCLKMVYMCWYHKLSGGRITFKK